MAVTNKIRFIAVLSLFSVSAAKIGILPARCSHQKLNTTDNREQTIAQTYPLYSVGVTPNCFLNTTEK